MRNMKTAFVPILAVAMTLATVAASALAQPSDGGSSAATQCDGKCSSQTQTCVAPKMICCCDISGSWTCVCKLPTDCNTGNNCQDGGASD